jgi:hypothetical protein
MPRKSRKAPSREPDPLDEYSTWDLRIAKMIYYSIIIASIITFAGLWVAISISLAEAGLIVLILAWGPGGVTLVIVAIIAAHMFLLVLFYTLFRGGILKLCQKLFKDRLLAKKYEDYTTLRLLLAVTLITIYIFIIALIFVFMPQILWQIAANIWIYMLTHFNLGEWILLIGVIMFIIILLVYIGFVLWNHGVFAVLKRVKRIEEEYEIEEEIKRDELKGLDEETLQKIYEKEMGKKAIYRGKETKGYIDWKNRMIG